MTECSAHKRARREASGGPPRAAALRAPSGTLRIDIATGAASEAASPNEPDRPTWAIPASEIDPSAATQYASANGRHILTTERVADDAERNKYRWTVTERTSGARVGELQTHTAFAPFVARGSVIVFETTPYTVGDNEQPAKLRGFDPNTLARLAGMYGDDFFLDIAHCRDGFNVARAIPYVALAIPYRERSA